VGDDGRLNRRPRGELHELEAVLSGEVRDRRERALPPEQLVRESGDVAHVDAGADHGAAGRYGAERERNERSDRRVDDGRVERHWWRRGGVTRPVYPELLGEPL